MTNYGFISLTCVWTKFIFLYLTVADFAWKLLGVCEIEVEEEEGF